VEVVVEEQMMQGVEQGQEVTELLVMDQHLYKDHL
jgi:hypothetical protein